MTKEMQPWPSGSRSTGGIVTVAAVASAWIIQRASTGGLHLPLYPHWLLNLLLTLGKLSWRPGDQRRSHTETRRPEEKPHRDQENFDCDEFREDPIWTIRDKPQVVTRLFVSFSPFLLMFLQKAPIQVSPVVRPQPHRLDAALVLKPASV